MGIKRLLGWALGLTALFTPHPAAAREVCGLVDDGTVWSSSDSPVEVTCDLNIAGLKIEEGVEVLLTGDYEIVVNGTIQVFGSEQSPVVFKPSEANTAGWKGIYFEDTIPGSEFHWCEIHGSNSSGLHLVRSYPIIDNCVFRDNAADYGGGIRAELLDEGLAVRNSFFLKNYANYAGGGIFVTGPTDSSDIVLTVADSVFSGNLTGNLGARWDPYGGAIYTDANLSVRTSTFWGNEVQAYTVYTGPGRYTRGGAIYLRAGKSEITASAFLRNGCRMSKDAQTPDPGIADGAGLYLYAGELVLENSLFAENFLFAAGGYVYNRGSALFIAGGDLLAVNNTYANNTNDTAVYRTGGNVNILNSILFFNYSSGNQVTGTMTITYSDVQHGFDGEGNLSNDPILDELYRIVPPSPCIDAGNPSEEYADGIPPGLGGLRNDMGYTGGPNASFWNAVEVCYRDADGDGYGNPDEFAFMEHCSLGYVVNNRDCDDARADVHSEAPEICDGRDNNCDRSIDESPEATESCSDGTYCNGEETCSAGKCKAGTVVDCNDRVSCTADACDEGLNRCTHTEDDAVCDDKLYCTGVEVCDETSGCIAGPGDPCSSSLVCDEETDSCVGCTESSQCDDQAYCNGEEVCRDRTCRDGAAIDCNDRVACTLDTCNEASDRCDHAPYDIFCDDGWFCNGEERCDPMADCQPGDGDPCEPPTICDEVNDVCLGCAENSHCDDDLFCNGVERCEDTVCVSGAPISCDDGVDCTADLCDESHDNCENTPNDRFCDDDEFCNGDETCSAQRGCLPGEARDCDDANDCTDDKCNERTDACDNACNAATPDDECCDNLSCTNERVCDEGCTDEDGDGYGDPTDLSCPNSGRDCDDEDPLVNPAAAESCGNEIDDDCDGLTDAEDGYDCDDEEEEEEGECGCTVFGTATSGPSGEWFFALLGTLMPAFVLTMRRGVKL